MSHHTYQSPLIGRYSSSEMQVLFSDDTKFRTWRKLWLELARAEQSLGIDQITDKALQQMEANLDFTEEDYRVVAEIEREIRHDVMSHVRRFGQVCPAAAPIIHIGATSCEVDDNTYLIVMREALGIIALRIARVLHPLAQFADAWKGTPTLGFTHFQPAQLVTVGKRAAMWAQDLLMDLGAVESLQDWMPFRGIKGTTGTQDSFLDLFAGDHDKVVELDRLVKTAFGFSRSLTITGQTYTRKIDTRVLMVLADLAASMHKMCTDLRLLASRKEIEEPFEKGQVGSSAMAYKRNPMREERNCALDRHPMALVFEGLFTQATQWFERTLDDSACRRLYIPEAFLAADGALLVLQNVVEGLVVYPAMIQRHVMEELPFMATEHIINAMVKVGANRQETHERIRVHAQAAGENVKLHGGDNDLIVRLQGDDFFRPVRDEFDTILDPRRFIGRCVEQVEEFITNEVESVLDPYMDRVDEKSELKV